MIADYKYSFVKNRRYKCFKCGSSDGFQYLIDNRTNEQLPSEFGKCHACSYQNYPKTEKITRHQIRSLKYKDTLNVVHKSEVKDRLNIPNEIYQKWLIRNDKPLPKFFEILTKVIGLEQVYELIDLYQIGMVPKQANDTFLFPYINLDNEIKAVQVKQFNELNKTTLNDWLHTKQYAVACGLPLEWITSYRAKQNKVACMMGEHLISQYPERTVIIHESLKNVFYYTAHVGLPNKSNEAPVQLASGAVSYLNIEKIKKLSSGIYRNLILMPDPETKAVNAWTRIYEQVRSTLSSQWNVTLIDLRGELKDLPAGFDIADFLFEQWNRSDFKPFVKDPEPSEMDLPYLPENSNSVNFSLPNELLDKPKPRVLMSNLPNEPYLDGSGITKHKEHYKLYSFRFNDGTGDFLKFSVQVSEQYVSNWIKDNYDGREFVFRTIMEVKDGIYTTLK